MADIELMCSNIYTIEYLSHFQTAVQLQQFRRPLHRREDVADVLPEFQTAAHINHNGIGRQGHGFCLLKPGKQDDVPDQCAATITLSIHALTALASPIPQMAFAECCQSTA